MSGHRQPMTLQRLKCRCRICGECWEWTGACNGSGHPKVAWLDEKGKTHKSARRIAWMLARGPLADSQLVTNACGNLSCLNPDHLKLTTKAEVARKTNARVAVQLKRRATSARLNQAKLGKITMEIAREIRSSPKTGTQLAKELGCSVSLVSHVRRNRSWVDFSNPFGGLVA